MNRDLQTRRLSIIVDDLYQHRLDCFHTPTLWDKAKGAVNSYWGYPDFPRSPVAIAIDPPLEFFVFTIGPRWKDGPGKPQWWVEGDKWAPYHKLNSRSATITDKLYYGGALDGEHRFPGFGMKGFLYERALIIPGENIQTLIRRFLGFEPSIHHQGKWWNYPRMSELIMHGA